MRPYTKHKNPNIPNTQTYLRVTGEETILATPTNYYESFLYLLIKIKS